METVKLVITDQQNHKRKTAELVLNSQHNLNAINKRLLDDVRNSLKMIIDREDIGVLLLSSNVSKAFSTGVDVKFIQTLSNEEAEQFFRDVSILLDGLAHSQFPLSRLSMDIHLEPVQI